MTPHDHNRTLGIIYGFLGGLLTAAALVELVRVFTNEKELERIKSETLLLALIIVGLLLTVILLSTAYGLFRRKPWARVSTLVLSGLFIWLFPLGTALAVYSWSFMYSEGAKRLYSRPSG